MKIYKYGDNVDTDVIIPARYLNAPDEKSLASHCMEDIDRDYVKNVKPGDVVVAGNQFRLRLQPGARAPGHQGLRGEVRHCQELCPHLLP